jgi:D-3-phosphoglycerate dehydrogenase
MNINKPFKIVVADPLHHTGLEILKSAKNINLIGPLDCDADLDEVLKDANALLICSGTDVDKELLDAAPQLKVVARAGARLDNVDIDEATRRGILVIHVPDANEVAMVEYNFLLMLMLARNCMEAATDLPNEISAFQLSEKNLGVIGYGRQGREVALRAQSFGMHVLAYDPYIDLSFARERGVEIVDLPELLARADIVSLHTDYTTTTRHIMNAEAFTTMKSGALLINCIHPELIDTEALLHALDSGKIAGAGLDILDGRTIENCDALLQHPKVLITHQLSQATVEAWSRTAIQVVTDMLAALHGEDYNNVVNLPFNSEIPYQTVKPYIDLSVKLGKLQGQLAEGWITRVEVELLGEISQDLVRPVAAVLLSGMIHTVDENPVNWVSAPILAFGQGIQTAQTKELVQLLDYPALIACRVYWEGGHRTVAGALFGNGDARLVHYNGFEVDAYPDGFVLILENDDVPGVIGKAGTRLSQEQINIAAWRYGRERQGGRAISFINVDQRVPAKVLAQLETEPEIRHARLVRL